jgi:hypothetical protein
MMQARSASLSQPTFLVQHQAQADDAYDVDYATRLSKRGLFIATRKPMAPRATFHVQFSPKRDARMVCAFCRVTEVTAEGVDAEFVNLDAESAQLLDAALA